MPNRRKLRPPAAQSADEIPGRQLACRVHHQWPSEQMVDGRKPPHGVWVEIIDPATNLSHLNDQCPRCGCIRYQKMPGGVYMNLPWLRKYPEEWVRTEEKFTSRDALSENVRRNSGWLFAAGESPRLTIRGDES